MHHRRRSFGCKGGPKVHESQGILPLFRGLARTQRVKVWLLFSWFFLTIATLWLLKPVRTASLLAHLGAVETPYVRLGSVAVVAAVVALYTHAAGKLSRRALMLGVSAAFALVLATFWVMLRFGGEALGHHRAFVWAVYILVDVYATVMVGVFWTYTNDVMTPAEADRLYGPIGLGGILGGVAGGVFVDMLAGPVGPVNMLLICAVLVVLCGAAALASEHILKPAPRPAAEGSARGLAAALEGAREVARSPYLLLVVGIVVAYEFAATIDDFVINVLFERAYRGTVQIAKMYGRLGWIVSTTAVVAQLVLVPLLLPHKRLALMVPPLLLLFAAASTIAAPLVGMAFLLGASDHGINYSLHQSTKETLYVPLTDVQKYKAKAFIDMLVDRAAKAFGAVALIALIARAGLSVRASLALGLVALAVWLGCAVALGRRYEALVDAHARESRPSAASPEPS